MAVELLIAINPDEDSRLPYLLPSSSRRPIPARTSTTSP
jgi:hypothetical protein